MKPSSPANAAVFVRGWRRMLMAFLAGAASTLALAPINFWPAMFLTFPPLVLMLDGIGAARSGGIRAAFAIGWWFGFGYFLSGLYWIGSAFLVDPETFGWMLPFAVTLLPAGLAVFIGLGFVAARSLWTPGQIRVLTFAAALSSAEWLRGHLFTGFPWNAFGYALTTPLPLAESVAVFGIWGLTFVAVAVFATPALLVDGARSLMPVVLAGAALATLAAYGELRLASHPTETVDGVRLRIMQPNIPQDERFRYAARTQIMSRYVSMSQRAGEAELPPHPPAQAGESVHLYPPSQDLYPPSQAAEDTSGLRGVTHLIWPESAFPFFLTREPDALSMIARMLAPNTTLITGAARLADPAPGHSEKRAYNSVYVIDRSGSILATYDKLHLVPFGEYLPFQDLLERAGLTQLIDVPGGFLPGAQRHRIVVPGAPDMLPLICYEAIFPGEAVPTGERPSWLLNLTNDAWFGISSGPYQHFQQARVRAIEEGLPLIRAANSGISAVIDPLGRVIAALPLGHEGLLDSALPRAIEMTIYARVGDFLFGVGALATMIASLLVRLMRERPTQVH